MKRRSFVKKSLIASAGIGFAGPAIRSVARSSWYDDVTVAVIGTNGRGNFLAEAFATVPGVDVRFICDVDDLALSKGISTAEGVSGRKPKGFKDIRKLLEEKSLDAIVIATPDHWHAPAAILGCQAGKHVYVEKPCCHNPAEGELLVKVSGKYNKLVQMGNQRRSHAIHIKAVKELHDGIIGRTYFARGWYANNRGPIGEGNVTAVPANIDYDLWQGPAPRRPYKDNVIHYNWHWFWHWGTAETCNNGTHEIDLMRWGFNAGYPSRVTSAGGRYHYQDDWEMPDTQVLTFDFPDNKTIVWEGRSCNGASEEGEGRGVVFYGENGVMKILGSKYIIFDKDNNILRTETEAEQPGNTNFVNTVGPGMKFDLPHIINFIDSVRGKESLKSDIATGFVSTMFPLLGNIAHRTGRTLNIDTENGQILNDPEAKKFWAREYEPGWEPVL